MNTKKRGEGDDEDDGQFCTWSNYSLSCPSFYLSIPLSTSKNIFLYFPLPQSIQTIFWENSFRLKICWKKNQKKLLICFFYFFRLFFFRIFFFRKKTKKHYRILSHQPADFSKSADNTAGWNCSLVPKKYKKIFGAARRLRQHRRLVGWGVSCKKWLKFMLSFFFFHFCRKKIFWSLFTV